MTTAEKLTQAEKQLEALLNRADYKANVFSSKRAENDFYAQMNKVQDVLLDCYTIRKTELTKDQSLTPKQRRQAIFDVDCKEADITGGPADGLVRWARKEQAAIDAM